MKKQLVTLMAVVFFAALTVTSVQAQSLTMSVTIPFDFAVAGKTFPAGEYHLQRSTDGERVITQIRSKDNALSMYLPQSHPVQDIKIQLESKSKLVFNKYGDQFFLSQVWIFGRRIGEEFPKTTRERVLQREMARNQRNAERIAVAGKSN
jgi:hypothetical protein